MAQPTFDSSPQATGAGPKPARLPVNSGFRSGSIGLESLAVALVVIVIFLFFWRPLFLGLQFYHSDTHALAYPVKELMTKELMEWKLPLWDPYSLCGYPIIGSYNFGAFLPHNLLFLVLPFPLAFKLFVIIKHLLAGLFQFLLLRRLKLSLAAAVAGSIVFALSGPLLSISSFLAFSFECLPLMIWLWWRVLDRSELESSGRWGVWWLAVFGFAFAFLHGDLQTVYTGFLLALFLPFALASFSAKRFWKSSLRLALMGMMVAALTAVQLFPSIAVLGESDRLELSTGERLTHSLSASGLAEMVNPFGLERAAFSPDFIAGKYVGFMTLALAMAGVILSLGQTGRRRRITIFFAITAVIALLLAMGKHFPLLEPLTYVLPGLQMFRYPQKWLGLLACALSILAASGISALPVKPRALVGGLAALMVLDLLVAMNPFLAHRLVDDGAYNLQTTLRPEEAVPGFSSHQRLLRLPTDGMMSGFRPDRVSAGPQGLENRQLRSQLIAWNVHTLFGNTASRVQLRRVSGITTFRYAGVEGLWQTAIDRGRIARATDLLAARWIVSSEQHLAASRHRTDIADVIPDAPATAWDTDYGRLVFLERPKAVPRALVVEDVVVVPDPETMLERLFAPEFDPHRRAVVLAATGDTQLSQTLAGGPEVTEKKVSDTPVVRFVEDGTTTVILSVERVPSQGGFLILNDTYDRGWRAWVNGEEKPILRANVYARAVEVPPGNSEVKFIYRPASLRWGLALSLTTLCISLLLAVGGWRRGLVSQK